MAGIETPDTMRTDDDCIIPPTMAPDASDGVESIGQDALAEPTLHDDETGATALETVMILGAIAIPSYFILMICLNLLTAHYRMLVTMNSLPFP